MAKFQPTIPLQSYFFWVIQIPTFYFCKVLYYVLGFIWPFSLGVSITIPWWMLRHVPCIMTFDTCVVASAGDLCTVDHWSLCLIILFIFQFHQWNPMLWKWVWKLAKTICLQRKCLSICNSLPKHSTFKCFANLIWKYCLVYWQIDKMHFAI